MWFVSDLGGNVLEQLGAEIKHSVVPALGGGGVSGMNLIGDAEVDVSPRRNNVVTSVKKPQRAPLDDAYGVLLVGVAGKSLRQVFSAEQLEAVKTGNPLHLTPCCATCRGFI